MGFKHGVEIGVQQGRFSEVFILAQWKSFESYRLVDLWGHQPNSNYLDSANVNQAAQDRNYNTVKKRLRKHGNKTILMRMTSLTAALKIPDASLDFAYVDARHDYCGVKEDLEAYWPKLRPGALMAGHDYVYAHEVAEADGNWSICEDGSFHPTAVRGAVDEFAQSHRLKLFTTQENHATWMFRKPFTAA
uniref:Methyltransferase domain-containing protein n=1 Tax=Grammatophora oceanica TaxID=210454 RepID=A0A7S1UV03_9STRA